MREIATGRIFRTGAVLLSVLTLAFAVSWGLARGDGRVIRTVAGVGQPGFSGNGGVAVEAKLNLMQGLVKDAAGNLYIAETASHVVRKVDLEGRITVVAGLGPEFPGFNGDQQPAAQAKLAAPTDVAFDNEGNLYIADDGNRRIRKIDTKGVISTVAGTGESGFAGDGGPATAAMLNYPAGIAFDRAGNLYIADSENNRIRRVDRSSGIISTVAGTGLATFGGDGGPALQASFSSPIDVAVGPSGDLFVADQYNHRVRRIGTDGTVTTVAGNGLFNVTSLEDLGDGAPAVNAIVRGPIGVAFDQAGNLYIAENAGNRVRRVDAASGLISTVAGSGHPNETGDPGDGGPADKAKLAGPAGVFVDTAGNVYISDSRNYRVRVVNAQ